MKVLPARALSCLFILCLFACGEDSELPPAGKLETDPARIDRLYGANRGPHPVTVDRGIVLRGSGEKRELRLNLYYPSQGRDFPLLLFSHGNWSGKDSYDRIIEHWASHGYAIIAPNHLDCCGAPRGVFNSLRYGQLGLVEARIDDMLRILGGLGDIETAASGFAGKADANRLALTGHSFGAFTAQQLGGARVFDPDTERFLSHADLRVRAVVALSPPGPMFDTIVAGSWDTLERPTLVSTGTWDVQAAFWPDWRMHLMSWESAIPGHKYALVTEGADHYLGNLICRPEREAEPQEDALRMVQIATTAFLDAYVKENPSARVFIADSRLEQVTDGFSRLSVR